MTPSLRRKLSGGNVPKSEFFRLNLTLPGDLDRFLEEFGTETKSSGGYKLPKTLILRALIRILAELDVDVSGVRTEEELLERLRAAIHKAH